MGDKFKSGGGNQQIAKDNATIINNYFAAQKESVLPSGQQQIFFGVPNLSSNYLPRPEYIDEFRSALQKESIGLIGAAHLGVEGMGGIGKSVLAAALAHDKDVQTAFPDGIFWLTFGQDISDDDLLAKQNSILNILGHQKQEIDLNISRNRLKTAIHGKKCLFVIDDIWDSEHLKCFDLSGTACRFLLTSRKADVLDRLGMERKRIDLLSEEQALAMLAQYARCAFADLPKESKGIVKECGCLPLAVAAIGSMVRNKPADRWQLALRKLQEAKLDKIACKFDYQYENIFRALQVSVEALPEAHQQYYKTMAIFPEDADIPESVVVMYWEYCAFSDDAPQDVIDAIVDTSLLTRVDDKTLRLHDLLRDYLISQTEDIAILHKKLFKAYRAEYPGGWHTIPYSFKMDGSRIRKRPVYNNIGWFFYKNWIYHIRLSGDFVLAEEIANDLIFNQHNLDREELYDALEFTNYLFIDISNVLLKINTSLRVTCECLDDLGEDAADDVNMILNSSNKDIVFNIMDYFVYDYLLDKSEECSGKLMIAIADHVKGTARKFIKESKEEEVLSLCIYILGDEAKVYADQLLSKSKNHLLVRACINCLGDNAIDGAKKLIYESNDDDVKFECIKFLGKRGTKEAEYLLEQTTDIGIFENCIKILKDSEMNVERIYEKCLNADFLYKFFKAYNDEAKIYANEILKQTQDSEMIALCLDFSGDESATHAKRLLIERKNDDRVVEKCLDILEDEGEGYAKEMLEKSNNEKVIEVCLWFLGDKAKEDCIRFIKERDSGDFIVKCLDILDEEAKEDARRLALTSKDDYVVFQSLRNLGEEAKEIAMDLLSKRNDMNFLLFCLEEIFPDDIRDEARQYLSEGKVGSVLSASIDILRDKYKTDLHPLFNSSREELLLVSCIEFLGKEAEETALQLIATTKDKFIRKECRKLMLEWEEDN